MAGVEQHGPSWNEAKTQWGRINARLLKDIPSLNRALLQVIPARGDLLPFGESPYARLLRYLQALDDVCQQALYAMERLPLFTCAAEYGSPWELYAKYYIYDFLSRVKTATDLVALVVNVAFDLGCPDEQCCLEKGHIAGALTALRDDGTATDSASKRVGATLSRSQNDWIAPFYDFRNLVIHRNGLSLAGAWKGESEDSRIYVHVNSLLQVASDRDVVERIMKQLGLLEGELSSTAVIEPVMMCETLWARVAELVNSVLEQSGGQIDHFVSEQRAARAGNAVAADDDETGG